MKAPPLFPLTPSVLFENTETVDLVAEIGDRLSDDPEVRVTLSRACYRPGQLNEILTRRPDLAPAVIERIPTSLCALSMALHTPSLSQMLLTTVLNDHESAFGAYILQARYGKFEGVKVAPISEQFADHPAMHRALITDAFDVAFFELGLSENLESLHLTKPGYAFEYLKTLEVDENFEFPQVLIPVLGESEYYSVQAGIHLRNHGYLGDLGAILATVKSARFAYLALRRGLIPQNDVHFRSLLLADPGWLVEFLTDIDADMDEVSPLYLNCVESAHQSPLIEDLNEWYRVVSVALRA